MMIVSTTGYIIACIGPFLSNYSNNDASIMNNILDRNTDKILNWLKKVDFLEYTPSIYSFDLGRHSRCG
jgi:hypothetical protein